MLHMSEIGQSGLPDSRRGPNTHRVSPWQRLHSAGLRPHRLLSVVTLGSGPHAFPLSSAQIKKILGILGTVSWGNSAKHIRWWSGMFYPEECSCSHTHIHREICPPTQFLDPGMLPLVQMGPLFLQCVSNTLWGRMCKCSTLFLVLCVWSLAESSMGTLLTHRPSVSFFKERPPETQVMQMEEAAVPCQASLPPHLKLHRWTVTHQVTQPGHSTTCTTATHQHAHINKEKSEKGASVVHTIPHEIFKATTTTIQEAGNTTNKWEHEKTQRSQFTHSECETAD